MGRFYEFRRIGRPGGNKFLKYHKECRLCGTKFSSYRASKTYCDDCSSDGHYKAKIIKKCEKCNKILNDARCKLCDKCKKKVK